MCETCEQLELDVKLKEQRADRLYNQAFFRGSPDEDRQLREEVEPQRSSASIEIQEAKMKLAAHKSEHET